MFIIRDPCKRCIVRACCRERCDKKYEYWRTKESLAGVLLNTMVGIAVCKILITIFS